LRGEGWVEFVIGNVRREDRRAPRNFNRFEARSLAPHDLDTAGFERFAHLSPHET